MAEDPVHYNEDDCKWYFWNETWSEREGPFDTRDEAQRACVEYAKHLEGA